MGGRATRDGRQAAFVHVKARTRFMVYGSTPARFQETDVWILSVPVVWVEGVAPGNSNNTLTQRCGKAVAAQYAQDRTEAIRRAQATAAGGGDYDAGHYVMEGASIYLVTDFEIARRPWKGHHRFFYRLDDKTWRKAGPDDEPILPDLSPFEDAVYTGWRCEQTHNWAGAWKAYEAARQHPPTSNELLGELMAGRVRARGKVKQFDEARALADEGIAALDAAGASNEQKFLVWVRLGESLIDTSPKHAGDAYDKAIALLDPEDARVLSLAQSAGLSALRQGMFATARPHFQRVVLAYDKRPPARRDHAAALNNLALTLEHAGELDAAEEHIRRAIQLHEQDANRGGAVDSQLSLARILARRGSDEAQSILRSVRPLLRSGTALEGLADWAAALLLRAQHGDTLQIGQLFDRAAQRLATQKAWHDWMEADRVI